MNKESQILKLVAEFTKSKFKKKRFIPGVTNIPVTQKYIDEEDYLYLTKSVLDGWFTSGKYYNDFENLLSQKLNTKAKSLFVNSGSSANLLALSTLCQQSMLEEVGLEGIKEGDEVITAAAGFPTTINPIFQNRLKPVFVDISIENLNVEIKTIQNAVTKKTKAIILAHTLGNPFRADLFRDFCKKNSIFLIEDTCDAFGAEIIDKKKAKLAGTFGDFSTLSFYPAHHITTGEGGAVLTSNKKLRRVAESVRDWGRHCWCESGCDNTCKKRFNWNFESLPKGYDHKYIYSTIGYNLKATDFQAALGCSQIKKIDFFIKKRRGNWNYLKKLFLSSKLLQENLDITEPTSNTNPSWFGFAIICKKNISRNQLTQFLNEKKIATRLLFAGNIIFQPAYKYANFRISGDLNNSNIVKEKLFWIGVHPNIDKIQIEYMIEILEKGIRIQVK